MRRSIHRLGGLLLACTLAFPAALRAEQDPSVADEGQVLRWGRELMSTRYRPRSRKLVEFLAEVGTRLAQQALATHVKHLGMSDREAFEALKEADTPVAHRAFEARASQASGEDEVSLDCILALAKVPGDRITRLLERLSADWSPQVSGAAKEALELRKEAGLNTRTKIKKVEVGALVAKPKGFYDRYTLLKAQKGRTPANKLRMRRQRNRVRVYPGGKRRFDAQGDPDTSGRHKPEYVQRKPEPYDGIPERAPLVTHEDVESGPGFTEPE